MRLFTQFWIEALSDQRRWLFFRLLCGLIWGIELFWIQDLAFDAVPWIGRPVLVQMFRFYLDLLFASVICLVLPRRWLAAVLALSLVCLTALGTYVQHFHWPLMPVRAQSQGYEGWSIRNSFPHLLTWRIGGVLLLGFGLKLLLVFKSGKGRMTFPIRWRMAVCLGLGYLVPIVLLQFTNLKLMIGPQGGYGRLVFVYGYTLPWIFDLSTNSSLEAHAQRAQAYVHRRYDRLTPHETPLAIPGHVIVLQLESVDGKSIEALHEGKPIMPFLRELKEQSLFYRIRSFHRNGSCDMDFACATFSEPYPGMVPYRLPGLEYTNSMALFMRQHGFRTSFFHGNTSLFYDRGKLIPELGFEDVFFKEQLSRFHLESSMIGVRDADLFKTIAHYLQSQQRAYVLAVTLDTHSPFLQLRQDEMELFPKPQDSVQRYLNALRYLDHELRRFIERLPDGSTVLLYGDHTTSMESPLFTADVVNGVEYITCLVYQKGQHLASRQRVKPEGNDGELNLLDVLAYLRNSLDCSTRAVTRAPLTPGAPPARASLAPDAN